MVRSLLSCAVALGLLLPLPAVADDAGRINAYVTPYYNSAGPVIHVGAYSAGLASKNPGTFVATIVRMKKQWDRLNFAELYVGAIQLYDAGYRNEAAYWFYTAQYRGRLFAMLVDPKKMGGMGDSGFELFHAQDAFFQLAGPNINGYAFGDIDNLLSIVRRVQSENRTVSDMKAMYPGVAFVQRSQWQQKNLELETGLENLETSLAGQKSSIAQQRAQNGTAARYSHLTSKKFPGGL